MLKRKISILLITILFVSSFFSCGITSNEEIRNNQIKAGVLEEYNNLLNASKDFKSIEKFDNYLLKWANKRGIRASYDKYENVIMSKSPTEGYSTDNSTTIQTSLGLDHMEERCLAVAMSLYLINGTKENNFMRVLFTNNVNGDFSGAKGLNSNFLSIDNQINLDWSYDKEKNPPKFTVTNGSAATATYKMFNALNYVDSTYSNAYEISINNLNGGDSGDFSSKHSNPIKMLGDLLASCKASGILFELGSFNGGSSPGTYPTNASITLVINENDVTRFTKKIETAQSKFNDTYEKTELNYTYMMTGIDKPLKVLSLESTNSIVSLLYTLTNGVYLRDETTDDIITTSNIGKISTLNNELELLLYGRSIENYGLTQLNDTFKIVASLSEVSHLQIDSSPLWVYEENNPLLAKITALGIEKYDIEPKVVQSFKNTENAFFSQNENLGNLLSVKVNMENYITQTQILLDLLKSKDPAE